MPNLWDNVASGIQDYATPIISGGAQLFNNAYGFGSPMASMLISPWAAIINKAQTDMGLNTPPAASVSSTPATAIGFDTTGTGTGAPGFGATPGATGGLDPFTIYRNATLGQESHGSYVAKNPDSGALGAYQIMPDEVLRLSNKLGLPYRPDLMQADTPAARQYQDTIGNARLMEAFQAGGGNPLIAAGQYYSGTTDSTKWGPKTQAYIQDIAGRISPVAGMPYSGVGANPFVAPQLKYNDPAALMGMIKDPTPIAPVTLPDAPALLPTPALPHETPLDKNALLAQLQTAAPQDWSQTPEAQVAKKMLLVSTLGGMAAGAARGMTIGEALAGAGAGGAQAWTQTQSKLTEDEMRQAELARQFKLMMAQQGVNIDIKNNDIENSNARADWQTAANNVSTDNSNAQNHWQVATNNVLQNLGITERNQAAQQAANQARAQVGISATEGNTATANEGAKTQAELNAQWFSMTHPGGLGIPGVPVSPQAAAAQKAAGLLAYGVPPVPDAHTTADPNQTAARNMWGYINAQGGNGVAAAVDQLAQEAVRTGGYDDIVPDNIAKQVDRSLIIAGKKKNADTSDAVALVRSVLANEDPNSLIADARVLATKHGSIAAKMFVDHAREVPAK